MTELVKKEFKRICTINNKTGKTTYFLNGKKVDWDSYFNPNFRISCMQTITKENYIRHYSIATIQ